MYVKCPTCQGTGWASVGLIGFDHTWKDDCPDCEGEREVSWYRAGMIYERNKVREARSWPLCPPSGTTYNDL